MTEEPRLPTVESYKNALRQLRPSLTANQIALLRAHFTAPAHTLTTQGLAAAVGYTGSGLVNTCLGDHAISVCATLVAPGTQDNTETLWVMHPEVVQALDQLGWFSV